MEARLEGGGRTDVRRRGDVVLRPARPWSRTIVALLRHLEEVGYPGSPRVVGDGFDADGREVLAYVPGEPPPERGWSDDAADALGVLLRDLHRATSTFRPPPDAVWRPWFGRELPATVPVIGHGDTAPWNVVARDGLPVAFVDWETAGPFDALWELAHTGWLNAQLYDDDVAALDGLPDAATRARRLALLVDGYGLPRGDRAALVNRMVEFAVVSARADAVESGATRDGPGTAIVWGVVWRTRSAAWIVRNRPLLLRALGA
ncbi:MAG: hypothetical protein QOE45_2387 [Frankiaceae bacterium]|nr:hypothetical protein [Frankiaceae bacterium]